MRIQIYGVGGNKEEGFSLPNLKPIREMYPQERFPPYGWYSFYRLHFYVGIESASGGFCPFFDQQK